MTQIGRFLQIGVGGKKCNCCFPAPGSKSRKAQYRMSKIETRKLIAEAV